MSSSHTPSVSPPTTLLVAVDHRPTISLNGDWHTIVDPYFHGKPYQKDFSYPHDERMTRLADRMGILVWSEIPVWQAIEFDNPAVAYLPGLLKRVGVSPDFTGTLRTFFFRCYLPLGEIVSCNIS